MEHHDPVGLLLPTDNPRPAPVNGEGVRDAGADREARWKRWIRENLKRKQWRYLRFLMCLFKISGQAVVRALLRLRLTATQFTKARRERQSEAARERAQTEEKERLKALAEFEAQRAQDISRELSINLSSGGAGIPYIAIGPVMAFGYAGDDGGGVIPEHAFHDVKAKLWQKCKYLGGDAVLFCRFEVERGVVYERNHGAAFANALISFGGAMSRTGLVGTMNESRSRTTITVWGYGTVVKLLPSDKPPSPDDYAAFSIDDLDLEQPNFGGDQ